MTNKFKFLKATVCLMLSLSMVFCITGCKKNQEETSSIIWLDPEETDSQSVDAATENSDDKNSSKDSNSNSSGDKKNNNSNGNGNGNGNKNDNSGNGSVAPVPPKQENITGEPAVKDLKGRKVVIVGTWDATSTSSPSYQLILQLEQKFNCDFVERKMSDYSSLYTSILSGAPVCDLFCPSGTTWINLAAKGMLQPLDTLKAIDFKDSIWNAATVKETNYNGHVYGMAYNNQIRQVLIYNKTMFKSNGWEDLYTLQKNGNLSWSKLFEIMKKAIKTNSSGTVTRYGLVPEYNIDQFGLTMLHANGVAVAKRDAGTKNFKNGLTSQSALNALNELQKWVKENGAVYDTANAGWDSGREIFYNNKAAMAVVSYQMFGTINNNADFDIGMVLFPHGPDTKNDYVRYEVLPTLMPANVKNANDVAMMWNYWAWLSTGGDGKKAENEYSEAFGGGESIEATTTKYINAINNGGYFIDDGELFEFDVSLSDVAYGNATPAEYVTATKNQFTAAVNNAFK